MDCQADKEDDEFNCEHVKCKLSVESVMCDL